MNEHTAEINRDWNTASEHELRRGYEAMANDDDREAEAFKWSEALIGECL